MIETYIPTIYVKPQSHSLPLTDACLSFKTGMAIFLTCLGQLRMFDNQMRRCHRQNSLVRPLLLVRVQSKSKMEVTMNWDQVKGNWKQVKGKVKQQWGKLTDDELDQIEGKRDQLLGKIQKQYGISKEEAERQVNDWERQL
jgi:uncharacterized protein YjbJ (UPF0337 family)